MIAGLKGEVSELREEVGKLEATRAKNRKLQQQVWGQNKVVGRLKTSVEELDKKIQGLNQSKETLSLENHHLRDELHATHSQLSKLEKRHKSSPTAAQSSKNR